MAKTVHVFMLILVLHVLEYALGNKFSLFSYANECSLLLQFKESMSIDKSASGDSGAYPKVASWNLNNSDGVKSCCLWDGVECSFGHVTGLDLSSSFLYGPIDSNNSLFNLIHLRTLNLADNDFSSSQIPSGIGRLSQLANLNLSYSVFSGEIPKQISELRNLVSLDLTENNELKLQSSDFQNLVQISSETLRELRLSEVNIDSELPASIGNLTHLNILDLRFCGFTGTLPASVSNLTQLTFLDLSGNELLITIPHVASLSKLEYLRLGDAIFDGNNSCDWLGKFPNLFYLDLVSTNLNCEILSSIGNQTQLRELHLRASGMIGQIPSSLLNLTHLTTLDLSLNKLTGSLPSLESFSNLTSLSLSDNHFDRWKLPDWFGKLKKVTYLDLTNVNLYGEIPSLFFNLTQLKELYLSKNLLKGQLPSSLLNFQNLESFSLYDNNITVEFYLFLSLEKLEYLDISGNNITFSVIDSHKNESQPKLISLRMASCNLKAFPEFLRFQHQLEKLYLDNNNIEGLIPGWVWNISKKILSELSLTHNLLTGFEQHSPVSPWLHKLDLSHNMLTGEIPPSICDFLSLQLLDLSSNNISGLIPPCLEKLSNSLVVLKLSGNTLQGSIPNIFTSESRLQMIDLSGNNLEGQVPRSLENCKSLQVLNLGYNYIGDMFPVWLGALPELQVLILRFNNFHGIIRRPSRIKGNFPKLRIIDLSYNSISGDLPHQYIQEWSAMKQSEASATFMFAYIMNGDSIRAGYWFSIQMTNKGLNMDYVKISDTFFAVDLSGNMFRGKIPESITTLTGLQLLNLSNNELSGVIPPSMGNLIHLEALDISGNKLSGVIPQDLVQLNFLAFLNVSNNNLTGPIPQGKQFNTFSNNSYIGNKALCGFPLSMKCGHSKESKPPKVSLKADTESYFPSGIDWVIILIGVVTGLVIGIICGDYLTTKYYKWFFQRFRM